MVDKVQKPTRGDDKSLAQPGRKQATVTEDFDVRIYNYNWRNISTIYIYNKTSIKMKYSHRQTKYIGKKVGLRTYQHHSTNL